MRSISRFGCLVSLALSMAHFGMAGAHAQNGPVVTPPTKAPAVVKTPEAPAAPLDTRVAVTVDGRAIRIVEVEKELARVLKGRELPPLMRERLQAETLAQLIDRQLVLAFLHGKKIAANEKEVDLEVEQFKKKLAQRAVALDAYLKQQQVDLLALRNSLEWSLSWQRFVSQSLTPENVQKYFDSQKRQFDGSTLRVAHILLKLDPAAEATVRNEAKARAEKIRAEIVAKKLTFAEAAKQHSQAPTAASGGDIGFIDRHETMPDSFSSAAFGLQPGEISPPIFTVFGVHLIQCLEVKPGERKLEEVRGEVERAALDYLFRKIADQQRPTAKIEFTGNYPHFKPGTEEVQPGKK